jgi:hypothetical protein
MDGGGGRDDCRRILKLAHPFCIFSASVLMNNDTTPAQIR